MTFTGSNIPYLIGIFIVAPALVTAAQWLFSVWP